MLRDEMSFCDLKRKEVINETDGRKLGRVCDLVFSPCRGHILGIIAPFNCRVFFRGELVYIPFKHIVRIGPDIILVRLTPELCRTDACIDIGKCREERKDGGEREDGGGGHGGGGRPGHSGGHGGSRPPPAKECDNRCEKCMLFDCERRWGDV